MNWKDFAHEKQAGSAIGEAKKFNPKGLILSSWAKPKEEEMPSNEEAKKIISSSTHPKTTGSTTSDQVDWGGAAGGIGGALLAHYLAKNLLQDDDDDENRSPFQKLVSKLLPIGALGAGAYGGYNLFKKGDDANSDDSLRKSTLAGLREALEENDKQQGALDESTSGKWKSWGTGAAGLVGAGKGIANWVTAARDANAINRLAEARRGLEDASTSAADEVESVRRIEDDKVTQSANDWSKRNRSIDAEQNRANHAAEAARERANAKVNSARRAVQDAESLVASRKNIVGGVAKNVVPAGRLGAWDRFVNAISRGKAGRTPRGYATVGLAPKVTTAAGSTAALMGYLLGNSYRNDQKAISKNISDIKSVMDAVPAEYARSVLKDHPGLLRKYEQLIGSGN